MKPKCEQSKVQYPPVFGLGLFGSFCVLLSCSAFKVDMYVNRDDFAQKGYFVHSGLFRLYV